MKNQDIAHQNSYNLQQKFDVRCTLFEFENPSVVLQEISKILQDVISHRTLQKASEI